ncbi:MAG: ceramidase domain-containing protein [Candidatus Methylomirabilales bacterium]
MDAPRQDSRLSPRALRKRVLLIVGLGVAATCAVIFLPPIAQDTAYHNFADHRTMLGVPNMLNAISNAPFVVVGILGLVFLLSQGTGQSGRPFIDPWERWPFVVLFLGVGLTGFGSAYYHLAPTTSRLFWDRLPMTIVFMALFVTIIAERIGLTAGRRLFWPLVAAGVGSVVYWHLGELGGTGDLRFYGLVQFFPLLAIPLMLFLFPPRYTRAADLMGAVGLYVLAKLFEHFDVQIFALGGIVSGHTLKHLASAAATYFILQMLRNRCPVESHHGRWEPAAPVAAAHVEGPSRGG